MVRVTWQRDDGTSFSTWAASDENGAVTYEPTLYFNSVMDFQPLEPRRGSWVWGPFQLRLRNGFGLTCLEVDWTVAVEPDGCAVADPEPHFRRLASKTGCWGWNEATLYGETAWCRGNAECAQGCASAGGGKGESCVKWGVVTYVAHGLSRLDLDPEHPGSLDGIPLRQGSVVVHRSPFGNDATYKTVCSLCAQSGGLPAPCAPVSQAAR